jgi:Rrf2 family transcriptional regulator, iron-sulfur cluster assembly transcription factor
MRLTTKGRFAVTAMLDLALNQDNGVVTLSSISERQKISASYLEQLFGKLRRKGLVQSRRGPGGGYVIESELSSISVTSIITAVDEPIDTTYCGGNGNCTDATMLDGHCITHKLWQTLNVKILDFLSSVTIQDLVDHVLHNKDIDTLNSSIGGVAPSVKAIQQKNTLKRKKQLSQAPIVNSIFNFGMALEGIEKNDNK